MSNAIKLENVGKRFSLAYQKDRLVKQLFSPFSPMQKKLTEFWALRNVNMSIEKGKVIGVIGRNGAGKTTLLNILAGTCAPTTGKIEINGKVSSLLTLGAGFQSELTGEENIYLNSSILGMTHDEVKKKYRSIVEFSELEGFLDSPLQTYSQGMQLRLGFSVAIHMDFDILLIDEILSVGDVSFQKKCFEKIDQFRDQGKTMVITTQSLDVIERLCEESFLFENGEVVEYGHSHKVTNRYLKLLEEKKLAVVFQQRYNKSKWWADKRSWETKEGSKEAKIINFETYNSHGKRTNKFKLGEKISAKASFVVKQKVNDPHFGIAIFREDGVYCYGTNTFVDGYKLDNLSEGDGFFTIDYKKLFLSPGKYRFSAAIWDKNELWAYDYHAGFYKFEIIGMNNGGQLLNLPFRWEPESWWKKFEVFKHKKLIFDQESFKKWQDKGSSPEVSLNTIELVDLTDSRRNDFHTGEGLKIKLGFKISKREQENYLWIGLFRGDDIYCHGVTRVLTEENISLVYHELPLLTGDYYLSVAIFRENQNEPLLYKHKISVFKMLYLGQDHGTAYFGHSWQMKLPQDG